MHLRDEPDTAARTSTASRRGEATGEFIPPPDGAFDGLRDGNRRALAALFLTGLPQPARVAARIRIKPTARYFHAGIEA